MFHCTSGGFTGGTTRKTEAVQVLFAAAKTNESWHYDFCLLLQVSFEL